MKKLVSAATSLVMAATMVGAVAPVVASAVDSSKSLSFLAYKDATLQDGVTANGSTVTVSADAIAAGDVVVPVGLYLGEATNDLVTITAAGTVKSDSADVSKVKFTAYQIGKDTYFSSAKDFTIADGTTFSSDKIIGHAGAYKKKTGYTSHGSYQYSAAESQTAAGTDNAYVGLVWTNGGSGYNWMGAKSDDFPVVVFDVTLPKGIANGEYVIDFCDYDSPTSEYRSCLLESTVKYDTSSKTSDLVLSPLTIKVGDSSSSNSSTTTSTSTSTQTTATTTNGGGTTTTTTASGSGVKTPSKSPITDDADITIDFTNPDDPDGYWRIDPDDGEYYVDIRMTSKSNVQTITSVTINLSVEGGFGGTIEAPCFALDENITANQKAWGINVVCQKADGHGTGIADNNILAMLTVDVPDGTPDGLYKITVDPNQTHDITLDQGKDNPALFVPMTVIPGYIAVGDAKGSTTTTSSATTTSSTTTTTTTTTDKGDDKTTTSSSTTKATGSTTNTPLGTPLYGDTNCDNQVKINDVVLLNKWLNDNKSYDISDQGKLNADCYNPKDGKELTAEDSDAIIKSIVHLVTLPVNK